MIQSVLLVAASCTQYEFPSREDDDDDDKPWNATKDDNEHVGDAGDNANPDNSDDDSVDPDDDCVAELVYDAKEDDDDDYIDEDVYDAKADDDFIDIDIESEDECRSSFPKGPAASRGIRLPGGLQNQDYSKMTASMAAIAKKEDRVKRKAWTDAQRMNRLKKKNTASPPPSLGVMCLIPYVSWKKLSGSV